MSDYTIDERPLRMKHLPYVSEFISERYGYKVPLKKDADTGYYNVGEYFNSNRDGLFYSVFIPDYADDPTTDCVKLDANAGLTCTPSTCETAGVDTYVGKGPFQYLTGNAEIDTDSAKPFATAIQGDTEFASDGSNGAVWVFAPVLYWKHEAYTHNGVNGQIITITDTPHAGFEPQPGAKTPSGAIRPFMLYAKYPLVVYNDGTSEHWTSASGYPVKNIISHNSVVNHFKNTEKNGLYGKTHADFWYVVIMFLMKYASKSSQTVYGGCTNADYHYACAVGQTNKAGCILTEAQASNFKIGMTVHVGEQGSEAASANRGVAWLSNLASFAKVTGVNSLGSDRAEVLLDCAPFTSTTTTWITSMGWATGATDDILGTDGAVADPTSMIYPYRIQGIELNDGFYESICNVKIERVLENDVQQAYLQLCPDMANATTAAALSDGYIRYESDWPVGAVGWHTMKDLAIVGKGLLHGTNDGGSTATGMGDSIYTTANTTVGYYEFLGLGTLFDAAFAGLFCVASNRGLSHGSWDSASRVSGLGRSAI